MKATPEEKEKVRRRTWRRWMKIFSTLGFVLLVAGLARLVFIREDYGNFRQFCRTIAKGQPLAEVRSDAEARGFQWNVDPEPSGFPEHPSFIVRPTIDWPYRFGCRINARGGFVTSIEK